MKKIFLSLFVLFGAVNSSFAVEIPDVMRKTMAQDPIGATGILQLVISMAFVTYYHKKTHVFIDF